MITKILGAELDATTNPDPNTLGTVSPYSDDNNIIVDEPSSAWTTQAVKALVAIPNKEQKEQKDRDIRVAFLPSVAGATYTITLWAYSPGASAWFEVANSTVSGTGNTTDYINLDGLYNMPLFFEINSISSGTLSILYDPRNGVII